MRRWIALSALALLVAGCGASSSGHENGPILAASAGAGRGKGIVKRAPSGRLTVLTTNVRDYFPTWSPDGTRIAFERGFGKQGGSHLVVMNADGSGLHQVGGAVTDTNGLSWSPDGRRIVFGTGSGLATIDAEGTRQTRLSSKGTSPTWSPDGKTIVFVGSPGLYAIKADGSGVHAFVPLPKQSAQHFFLFVAPSWSQDGQHVLFIVNDLFARIGAHPKPYPVEVVDANGAHERTLAKLSSFYAPEVMRPAWSPDGKSIAFASYNGTQLGIWTASTEGGKPRLLLEGSEYSQPSWGPAGA